MGQLETALRTRREQGRKAFVPYVTGGFPGVDAGLLRALQDAGADAIEVGIPFSDPVMDGGVIQEASRRALNTGCTPALVLDTISEAALSIPVGVMTYVNPVLRLTIGGFLDRAKAAGVSGVIVPDLPVDECDELCAEAGARQIDTVLLAAPGTSSTRLMSIAERSHGFVYCVATYGVTGTRAALSTTARTVVEALRPISDLPLLVGVGIASPEHATEACGFADGVVVGSALMSLLVDGEIEGAVRLASSFADAVRPLGVDGMDGRPA